MKKLLSVLSIIGMSVAATAPIAETNLLKDIRIDKINLGSIEMDEINFDIEGEKDVDAVEQIALFSAAMKYDQSIEFINHYIANDDQYTTLGRIDGLPEKGKKLTFNYKILATPKNDLYVGMLTFSITLINSGGQITKPLETNEELNYSNGYRVWTSFWVWDSYSDSSSVKVLNWRKYADTWTEFLEEFGQGKNEQSIIFDVYATATTDFYASETINTTIEIKMEDITETKTMLNSNGQFIDMYSTVGTSKLEVKFNNSFYRDDEFVYIDTYFFLGLSSFSVTEVEMTGIVGNLRFYE